MAVHEAGHAIAAHILGDSSAYATIVPDEKNLGHCGHAGVLTGADRGVLSVAGAVAEELYAADQPVGYLSGGDDERFSNSLPIGLKDDCRRKARRLLGGCVRAVQRVAGILEARDRVTAREVADALATYPPQNWF